MTPRAHRLAWAILVAAFLVAATTPGPSWAAVVTALAVILAAGVLLTDLPDPDQISVDDFARWQRELHPSQWKDQP